MLYKGAACRAGLHIKEKLLQLHPRVGIRSRKFLKSWMLTGGSTVYAKVSLHMHSMHSLRTKRSVDMNQ